MILEKLGDFGPSLAPEWGSGGVFGLRYHRGVLYFTLAFDGKAFFLSEDRDLVYNFDHLGREPGSGGDTYNAVDVRDEEIFFGGWVHKPIRWKLLNGRKAIDFSNKYSHIHSFNVNEWSVSLLWSETMRDPERWCGEVTDLIYNPVRDSLLVARGDGFANLGVFELSISSRDMRMVSGETAVKGAIVGDSACFDISGGLDEGVVGIQCFDLSDLRVTFKTRISDFRSISVDGGNATRRGSGYATSAYSHYLHFTRGGLIIAEPERGSVYFLRLLDFGNSRYTQPTPQRSNSIIVGGGILAPFSSYSHTDASNPLPVLAPSLLLYLTPPAIRVVGLFGARITSVARLGSRVLLGYTTHANTMGPAANLVEFGRRGVTAIEEERLTSSSSPPVVLKFRGVDVGSEHFGGVPLLGYRRRHARILASKLNKLTVYEYDAGIPPQLISVESYSIGGGRVDNIDLEGFNPLVSFKLETEDPKMTLYVQLE